MKIKDLDDWPSQEWKSDAKRLAPEDALDGTDVSASVRVDESNVITVTVRHNDEIYAALLHAPEELAKRVVLIISGVAPEKTLREIGELDIDSEAAR
jgi:hypothetical protein